LELATLRYGIVEQRKVSGADGSQTLNPKQARSEAREAEARERHWRERFNPLRERVLIGNLLVRIHLIIVMIRWTGLAPWEFEFPFPSSLTSTFLEYVSSYLPRGKVSFEKRRAVYRGTSPIRKRPPP